MIWWEDYVACLSIWKGRDLSCYLSAWVAGRLLSILDLRLLSILDRHLIQWSIDDKVLKKEVNEEDSMPTSVTGFQVARRARPAGPFVEVMVGKPRAIERRKESKFIPPLSGIQGPWQVEKYHKRRLGYQLKWVSSHVAKRGWSESVAKRGWSAPIAVPTWELWRDIDDEPKSLSSEGDTNEREILSMESTVQCDVYILFWLY